VLSSCSGPVVASASKTKEEVAAEEDRSDWLIDFSG
jgi:hypothetical protein